jgi:hypothetical protein
MVLTHVESVDLIEKLLHYNRAPCLFVFGVIRDAESLSRFCSYGSNKRQDKRANILFGFKSITGDYTLSPDTLCACVIIVSKRPIRPVFKDSDQEKTILIRISFRTLTSR